MRTLKTSPQYPAKGGGTISGDPVNGVEVQGIMDGPVTCYSVHGVQVQASWMDVLLATEDVGDLERGMWAQ